MMFDKIESAGGKEEVEREQGQNKWRQQGLLFFKKKKRIKSKNGIWKIEI